MTKFLNKLSFQDELEKLIAGYVAALERLAHNPRFTKTSIAADVVKLKALQKGKLEGKIKFFLDRFEAEHALWEKRYRALLVKFSKVEEADIHKAVEDLLVS